jgi:hypothetical protein
MKRWEYKKLLVETYSIKSKDLNVFGEEGWELVSTHQDNSSNFCYLWFKREKIK